MLKLTIIIYTIIAIAFPLYSKPEKTITYKVDAKYIALRKMLFTIKPADIELSKQDSKNIWGFVMEMGYPEAVVTLFALKDGTVSLYFSSGGVIIGCGQHTAIRKAGFKLLNKSSSFLSSFTKVNNFSYPQKGWVSFYFFKDSDIYFAKAKEAELMKQKSKLLGVFSEAQFLLTKIREYVENKK